MDPAQVGTKDFILTNPLVFLRVPEQQNSPIGKH